MRWAWLLLLAACDKPDPTLARMQTQRRVDPFEGEMRAPVADTVARDDDTDTPAPPVTRELLSMGRARYDQICAACHGRAGDGQSWVSQVMEQRPPPSLHQDRITRDRAFTVATTGYGLMPSFAHVLPVRERWAVASYVRALQVSRSVRVSDLPPDMAKELP